MKKSVLFSFLLAIIWFANSGYNPGNPPLGCSGAPGEQTCSQPGCHSGGTQTGTVTITGLPAEVVPSKAYAITVTCASAAAKNGGMMATVLDGTNTKSGALQAGANLGVASSGGREYVRQTKAGTYASGSLSYSFTWTAPATSTNKDITLYCAMLAANGNGGSAGDIAFKTSAKTVFKATATIDPILDAAVKVFPNPVQENLNIEVNGIQNTMGYLFDGNGRQVKKMYLDEVNQINVQDLASGNYLLQIMTTDGKQTTRKVIKN